MNLGILTLLMVLVGCSGGRNFDTVYLECVSRQVSHSDDLLQRMKVNAGIGNCLKEERVEVTFMIVDGKKVVKDVVYVRTGDMPKIISVR